MSATTRASAGANGIRPFTVDVPERACDNLIYYNQVDKGNHFAAWHKPDLFASEVRVGLRSLR